MKKRQKFFYSKHATLIVHFLLLVSVYMCVCVFVCKIRELQLYNFETMNGRIMTEVTTVKRGKTLSTAFVVNVIVIAINHVVFFHQFDFYSRTPNDEAFCHRSIVATTSATNLAYDLQFLILPTIKLLLRRSLYQKHAIFFYTECL